MTVIARGPGLALRHSGADRLRAIRGKLPPFIVRPHVMQNINLFLWRHAEAEDSWPDLERPLTPRGQRDAARVAKILAKQLDANSRIVISPATRTRETAGALAARASLELEIDARLAPGAAVGDVLDAIEAAIASCNGDAPSLVLVGHQPWLGQVARHLLTGHDGDWSVKKAAPGGWCVVRATATPSGRCARCSTPISSSQTSSSGVPSLTHSAAS